jgi:hypothetical protein
MASSPIEPTSPAMQIGLGILDFPNASRACSKYRSWGAHDYTG